MIFLKAILLAVVEGITEFLPISSTGHMILVDEYLKLTADSEFTDAFIVVIQLPAILSVVLYFWRSLWPFGADKAERAEKVLLWLKIMTAFLPAAIIGALLNDFIERRLFNSVVVGVALLVGGIALIALERRHHKPTILATRDITFKIALFIGLAQCLAMIPGTSRSAATIIGALLLGASRVVAAEFSFFLAIPTMAGAAAFTLLKTGLHFNREQWLVLGAGCVVSFGVAFLVIAGLMSYIRRKDFRAFGYYRIVLAILVLIFVTLVR